MKFLTGLPRHATGGLVAGGIVGGLTPCLSQHSLIVSISFTLVWLMVVSLQLHFVWLALGALLTTAAIAVFPEPTWALIWLLPALILFAVTWPNTLPPAQHKIADPQWGYLIAALFMFAGVVNFGLISLRLPPGQVGAVFALAMLAAVATASGAKLAYRRSPVLILTSIPVLTTVVEVLALSQPAILILVGAVLWGAVVGLHRGVLLNFLHTNEPRLRQRLSAIVVAVVVAQAIVTGVLFTDAPLVLGVFISVTQAIAAIIVLERSKLG